MKNLFLFSFLIFVLIFVSTGCSTSKIVGIPDGYVEKEEYYDENGFQDFTDYAKYVYASKEVITNNEEYKKIEYDDIGNIIGYFENFYTCMEASDRLSEFDFDLSVINEGDYVKINTKEGQKIGDRKYGKYENYSIYYFDVEALTLYYMHSNI